LARLSAATISAYTSRGRARLIARHDVDRAEPQEPFPDRCRQSYGGHFAQRTIKNFGGKNARQAKQSLIRQDIQPPHPMQRGPRQPRGDQKAGGVKKTAARSHDSAMRRADRDERHHRRKKERLKRNEPE
jgi:hypothetical protein